MKTSDWSAVKAIYEQGIATKLATFETSAPEWADWDVAYLGDHRLVAEQGGDVVGWAALLPTSRRSCYAGVVENSVYVAEGSRGQGIGRRCSSNCSTARTGRLLDGASVDLRRQRRQHRIPPALRHFRVVGTRERIGQLDGVWRDTVLLERRSP